MSYTPGQFDQLMRDYVAEFAISETSGVRTKARNTLVGGANASRHMLAYGGKARDFACDTPADEQQLVARARADSLVVIVEADHVHVHDNPAMPGKGAVVEKILPGLKTYIVSLTGFLSAIAANQTGNAVVPGIGPDDAGLIGLAFAALAAVRATAQGLSSQLTALLAEWQATREAIENIGKPPKQ